MKSESKKNGGPEPSIGREDLALEGTDEFVTRVRQHFAEEFPNPDRIDCPSPDSLSLLVQSGSPPGAEVTEHLLTCSECIRDYRHLLNLHRAWLAEQQKPQVRTPVMPIRWVVAAATVAMVVICLGIVWRAFITKPMDSAPSPTQSLPPASDGEVKNRPAPSLGSETAQDAPQAPRASENSQRERAPSSSLLAAKVEVDLRESQPVRGEDSARPKTTPIRLPSSRIDVSLILPEGSLSGVYRIAIEDTFGNLKTSAKASSSDGARLNAHFNLARFRRGEYIMCISRAQEAPICYPVIVEAASQAAISK